ncbi:molybdopterin oxidoreductase family protein [Clostridium thermobutyricum]|uniref:Nitrate reductase n=1 Tax=Clostridium thermobutyricum DSM 4928 TaxID=1121339 RepID=A0A1V4SVA7_9CLOT|nr:molybdopterin-dependent oxidoreductase [Clostridium thermobutyricum]OPX47157.1 nitrate reductase [Clostridium thermobutyricum DSM 4928]
MKKIQSTCNYCSIACNLDFYVENNKIVKVHPTEGHPINNGFCCIKGLNLDKQNTIIKTPKGPKIKNENGVMETVSWDKAFEETAKRIKDIQEKYGKESFAFISTGQLDTTEMALIGHIGRTYLGGNGDGNTRLCMATSVVAHKQSFGFDAPPYSLKDLELSDTIFLFGSNPVVAHPIIWGKIRDNKNAKIIVVDPRKSETAKNAHIWVDIKPKADLTLLYTMANVLIEKNWIDKEFIENNTEGFSEFKEFVKDFTLDKVYDETGISKERVLELVDLIHNGKKVSLWWTMGVNQSYQAVRTAQGIINLALITGNIGKPGTGPNSITGQCNAMGSRLFSNTTGLYGGGDYGNESEREKVANALKIDKDMLPTKPTIPYNMIIEKAIKGEIKALWIVATNPVHSWTNNESFKKAIENLDLFIVQDIYDDTDSSVYADILLPSTSTLKKEGFLINTERRLTGLQPVLEKEENEKDDYEIFLGVGNALGMGDALNVWKTKESAFNVLKACTKGLPCDITGVNYEDLMNSKGIQWPFKEGDKLTSNERRLFEDGQFFTPNKKAKILFENISENPVKETEEYPYILNTGRGTVGQWHTQTRTREIAFTNNVVEKEAYVYVNREDAEKLGIKTNDYINLSSINGNKSKFVAKVTDDVKKGQLYAPLHYIETNALTPSVYDTYSKEPSYKTVAVNIEIIK